MPTAYGDASFPIDPDMSPMHRPAQIAIVLIARQRHLGESKISKGRNGLMAATTS